uniref:Uncharacterized protein AlNc14C115G6499 n=1 Tax=Albugo laibachii Nc14 TaxID=890382 RepID=F0WIW2_9STRA|nr:conserved hypothetical protein [Albugo laibachii Nc14]|eukprot:CCA21208.1 conserved hypothetical protein [Albugo laibachii Nc14]
MFVMALGLVLQALSVYVCFYQKNKQMDFDEVFVAQDLIELLEVDESYKDALNTLPFYQRIFARTRNFVSRNLSFAKENDYSSKRLMRLVHTRTLRHYFLVKYGLPYSFPFAKYLKKAQEAQINMMLEVKLSTWIVLFLALTLWELIAGLWAEIANKKEAKPIFYTFTIIVWLLLLVQIAVAVFLENAILKIANRSGHTTTIEAIDWLKELAAFEKIHQVSCKHFKTIIRIMLQVQREQERKQHNAESTAPKLPKWCPPCIKNKFEHAAVKKYAHESSLSPSQNNLAESVGTTIELDMSNCPGGVTKGVEFPIKFFNPVVMEGAV